MTTLPSGRRQWPHPAVILSLLVLAVAIGCAGRRPLNSPPEGLITRAWLNRCPPTPDLYPDPDETTVAGLAAALGADPGPAQPQPTGGQPLNVLVLSGGGKYGA